MSNLFYSLSASGRFFELLICFFLLVGGVFCLGGSIGLMRFPDVYCKMQALSKPVTLGIFNLIIAYILFLFYAGIGLSLKGLLAMVFLLLTVPIGSHMLAKAAYRSGVPIWTESLMDQLAHTSQESGENREAQIRAEVWNGGRDAAPGQTGKKGKSGITATKTEKYAASAQRRAQEDHILTDKAEHCLDMYATEWTRDPLSPVNLRTGAGWPRRPRPALPPKPVNRKHSKRKQKK